MATSEIIIVLGCLYIVGATLQISHQRYAIAHYKRLNKSLESAKELTIEENTRLRRRLGCIRKRATHLVPENYHVDERVRLMNQIPESWENL